MQKVVLLPMIPMYKKIIQFYDWTINRLDETRVAREQEREEIERKGHVLKEYTNQGYDIHKILKEFDDRGFNYVRDLFYHNYMSRFTILCELRKEQLMQCCSDVYRSSLLQYAAESAHSDFIPHLIDEDGDTPFTLCMCVW